MADIDIERTHKLGASEAKKRFVDFEPKLKERWGVSLSWTGNQAAIKGTGVNGSVQVTDTRLTITIKLGFLIRPFTAKIRDTLARYVDQAIA